jgi:hypothetical protein
MFVLGSFSKHVLLDYILNPSESPQVLQLTTASFKILPK